MTQTILFLCPHHAAKSLMAASYFNQQAGRLQIPFTALSAGTDPAEAAYPVVVEMLAHDGLNVSHHRPRRVTPEELHTAARIISMGCTAEDLSIAPERVEHWDDVSMVSQTPHQARDVIRARVAGLIANLVNAQ